MKMLDRVGRTSSSARHALFAMLLVAPVPVFIGALLSDWAYSSSYEVQWKNFASWLLAGGLVFVGFALLWAAVAAWRGPRRNLTLLLLPLLWLATFIVGFVDALVHAKDAYASMPAGFILSAILVFLAFAASWIGLSGRLEGDGR
jgi:uncharacterized membrane protein